jgi:hypothetical protein
LIGLCSLAAASSARAAEPARAETDTLSFGLGLSAWSPWRRPLVASPGLSLELDGEWRRLVVRGSWMLGASGQTLLQGASLRAGVLLVDGPIAPYATAGIGWFSQSRDWDDVDKTHASGLAPVFEVGVLLRSRTDSGRIGLGVELVPSTFLQPQEGAFGFASLTLRLLL